MVVILETERLILRTWDKTDREPMALIDQDKQVCQFLPAIGTKTTTNAIIERSTRHYDAKGFCLYAVELKATGEMIGFLGLITSSFEAHFTPAVEIGWRIASRHWNKGYATEGARAVLDYAFTHLNLDEVVSFTVTHNQASRRVMEKIGLQHNPIDDFNHPKLPDDSPLRQHVLYRLSQAAYLAKVNNINGV
ncbi:MAG: GNAT family N-acetyltransferase [Gammaproteobacteria bacterium]|nr:GNAT family N-acetyltransferase [Gammaproteobacteria bacterium]